MLKSIASCHSSAPAEVYDGPGRIGSGGGVVPRRFSWNHVTSNNMTMTNLDNTNASGLMVVEVHTNLQCGCDRFEQWIVRRDVV